MSYKLPPLNTLRLFEAAGRHASFKIAAEELHVTPSAVSHGIQTLEQWLGVPLFIRGTRTLELTSAGYAYLPRVRDALDELASATEAVSGRRPSGKLTVSVAVSFGMLWLMPKLAGFKKLHPEIDVTLDTAHRHAEFPRDGVDAGIRMAQSKPKMLYSIKLMTLDLVPVVTPEVASTIRCFDDLKRHSLLHVAAVNDDWATWAKLARHQDLDLTKGLRFDTIQMAQEAAVQGIGVAMGRLPLITSELNAGRLSMVLGPPHRCETSYWFVTSHDALTRPEIQAFRDWIQAELATG